MKHAFFKSIFWTGLTVSVVLLSGCGTAPAVDDSQDIPAAAGDLGSTGDNQEAPEDLVALKLTAQGAESSDCSLKGVFAETDEIVLQEYAKDYSFYPTLPFVAFDDLVFWQSEIGKEDLLLTAIDGDKVFLFDADGALLSSELYLDEVMTDLVAQGTTFLSIAILSEDLALGDYEMVFAAGAFTCSDGTSNVASYTVDFTIAKHVSYVEPKDCPSGSSCSFDIVTVE